MDKSCLQSKEKTKLWYVKYGFTIGGNCGKQALIGGPYDRFISRRNREGDEMQAIEV